MNTFVYCWLCFLFVCCRAEKGETDYNNDSPDTLPRIEHLRFKVGSNVVIKCNKNNLENYRDNIVWEFLDSQHQHSILPQKKPYQTNYRKNYHCNNTSLLDSNQWKKVELDQPRFHKRNMKLEIQSANETDIGMYRCVYKNTIVKTFCVDLVALYQRPSPNITSLVSSNLTASSNGPFVIQCKVTSVELPKIFWFKECSSVSKCEAEKRLPYDGQCYCPLPTSNYACANISQDSYISKLVFSSFENFISGTYVCLAISLYGEDHKNITIQSEDLNGTTYESNSFSLLFLIPVVFILVPLSIWLGFHKRRKKIRRKTKQFTENEQQKQLISPVVVQISN